VHHVVPTALESVRAHDGDRFDSIMVRPACVASPLQSERRMGFMQVQRMETRSRTVRTSDADGAIATKVETYQVTVVDRVWTPDPPKLDAINRSPAALRLLSDDAYRPDDSGTAPETNGLQYGRLDQLAPAEYAAFRANPTKENFDRLVAKVAADRYAAIDGSLRSARSVLADPTALTSLAEGPGVQALALKQYLDQCALLERCFKEMQSPDGVWYKFPDGVREDLQQAFPDISAQDLDRLDLRKMTPETFLSLPADLKAKLVKVFEDQGEGGAAETMLGLMRSFDAAGVSGADYGRAKALAMLQQAKLYRDHPELIALMKDGSAFRTDLLGDPGSTIRFHPSTGTLDVTMTPSATSSLDARVSGLIAQNGTAKYLGALDDTISAVDSALSTIRSDPPPSFEKLGFIAGEVAGWMKADADFFQGQTTPDAVAYQNASKAAQQLFKDAADQQRLQDLGMMALGGASVLLGIGAFVAGFFTGGATWALYLAGAGAVAGGAFSILDIASIVEENNTAALNVPGFAQANGASPPTAGDWARAILDGVATVADVAVLAGLPRAFQTAVRAEMIADVAGAAADRGLDSAAIASRLNSIDDVQAIRTLSDLLRDTDATGASAIISNLSSLSDAQIVALGRNLDPATTTALASLLNGADAATASNVLRTVAGLSNTAGTEDFVLALTRLQSIDPAAAETMMASPSAIRGLAAVVRIGSTDLVTSVLTASDPLAQIANVAAAIQMADDAGLDAQKLFLGLARVDPQLVLDVANSPNDLPQMLASLNSSIDLAAARGLGTDLQQLGQGSVYYFGRTWNMHLLGPVMVLDAPGEEPLLIPMTSSQARNVLANYAGAMSAQGQTYDLRALRPYLIPEDAFNPVASTASWTRYDNANLDVIHQIDRLVQPNPPTFTYTSAGVAHSIDIYDVNLSAADVQRIRAQLQAIASADPSALDGIGEIHGVDDMGYYAYASGARGNYAGLYQPQGQFGAIIDFDPNQVDTGLVTHEVAHNIWASSSLAGDPANPFVQSSGSGFFTPYGATNPEENFCEGAVQVMRDHDQIVADPQAYLRRYPALRDKIIYVFEAIYGVQIP
jgi:hypothetical protein